MIAHENEYMKLMPASTDCNRPRGGNCTGNCRKLPTSTDCLRPIGGRCQGNCRKSENNIKIEW